MKTIFLAAGKSSRIDPLEDKNFLEFCGKPLIQILLENAYKGGLDNFIIVGNKENKIKIEDLCKNHKFLKTAVITTQPNLEEGMAGGVIEGLKFIENTEELFILGGNDFVDPKIYKEILKQSKKYDGGILAKKVETYFPGGYLEIDETSKIKSIIEKPEEGKEPSNLVNIIGHYFKKAEILKKQIQKATSKKDDIYEVALQKCFENYHFKAIKYENYWQAIKYPWDILDMSELIIKIHTPQKNFIHKTAQIAKSATIKGEHVYIDENAKIFENAVINGPCYIGKESIIGNNALVRESNIGRKSVAGYNTEIARSYIANQVTTHIAYIGDSIIDDLVNFGAYSTTANLRLDKDNVKVKIKDQLIDSKRQKLGAIIGKETQVGIHTMLMPGTKIEKKSLLFPGKVYPQKAN